MKKFIMQVNFEANEFEPKNYCRVQQESAVFHLHKHSLYEPIKEG